MLIEAWASDVGAVLGVLLVKCKVGHLNTTARTRVRAGAVFGALLLLIALSFIVAPHPSAQASIRGENTTERLRREAATGSPESMTRLAVALAAPYWKTPAQIPEQDLKDALYYLELAARLEHPAAQYNLARFILRGFKTSGNVEQDQKEVFDLFRSSAEKCYGNSRKPLAERYRSGKGCGHLPEFIRERKAFQLYKVLAESGDMSAMGTYIELLENGIGCIELAPEERVVLRLRCFEKQAEAGDTSGINRLVQCLYEGIGCERSEENLRKACNWNQRGAELKNVVAMSNLANMLHHAIGCEDSEENREKALYWYEQAAILGGTPNVMHLFADCLADGVGCGRTSKWVRMKKAVYWYEKAAALGLSASKLALGMHYSEGTEGVSKDYVRAAECLESIKNEYKIYRRLGNLYLLMENLEKALENYLLALEVQSDDRKLKEHISSLRKAIEQKNARGRKVGTKKKLRKKRGAEARSSAQAVAALQAELDKKVIAIEAKRESLDRLAVEVCSPEPAAENQGVAELHRRLNQDYEEFRAASQSAEVVADRQSIITRFEALLSDYDRKFQAEVQVLRQKSVIRRSSRASDAEVSTASEEESSTQERRRVNQETRAAAVGMENKARLTKLKKELRVPEKPTPEKRAQLQMEKKSTAQKSSSSSSSLSSEEEVSKPFAEVRYELRTAADLNDVMMGNVYFILDAIKAVEVREGEDPIPQLLGVLRNLEGDFNFIDVKPAYAGLPNAEQAFELRINGKYRVLFGVKGAEIYKGMIYIDDPHV